MMGIGTKESFSVLVNVNYLHIAHYVAQDAF